MDCKLVRTHLDAYVDGELEPTPVLEFERHLDDCTNCRSEVSLSRLIQQGVGGLPVPPVPASLRRRVSRAIDAQDGGEHASSGLRSWPSLAGFSAAALVLMAVGVSITPDHAPSFPGSSAALGPVAEEAMGLFGDVVARHTDQLPADIPANAPEQVNNWFRSKVGFRVRSVEFTEPQVHLVGARVSHIRERQAASFYYTVGDSRLTTVVFPATPTLETVLHDGQLLSRSGARQARIGGRMVTYQNVQGYTVPIIEHDGIVYAFTGDLDQRRLLHLVSSARLP